MVVGSLGIYTHIHKTDRPTPLCHAEAILQATKTPVTTFTTAKTSHESLTRVKAPGTSVGLFLVGPRSHQNLHVGEARETKFRARSGSHGRIRERKICLEDGGMKRSKESAATSSKGAVLHKILGSEHQHPAKNLLSPHLRVRKTSGVSF